MPEITKISAQRQREDICNISIDGQYAFALSALEVGELRLQVGQTIGQDEVDELAQRADISRSYSLAVRYLATRMRSRAEVVAYLEGKGAADTERVLDRLTEAGLIDDEAFARAWVDDRRHFRPRSRQMLMAELKRKGLGDEAIAEGLRETDELSNAIAIARKRVRIQRSADTQKLYAYLARQGFDGDVIKKALKRLDEE